MDAFFRSFKEAHVTSNGYQLAEIFLPTGTPAQPNRLYAFHRSINAASVTQDVRYNVLHDKSAGFQLSQAEGKAWIDVCVAYWKVIGEILKAEEAASLGMLPKWTDVYQAWKEMTNAFHRGYTSGGFEAWTVPCLYVAGKYLRIFAIKADQEISSNGGITSGFQEEDNPDAGKNEKLEDAARSLNRIFQLCVADRAPLEESRKWGIYNIVNLLFKTYFKLNSISLSKNILRALQASKGDLPDLEAFPKSHQVTFKYYVGVILFLEEDYVQAEASLTEAWQLCHKTSMRNKELILTYLIPCHLLTTHTLPTHSLLQPYPRLQVLFLPLSRCIKYGDLSGFDAALAAGEDEFVKRRIYLTLERGRDIALRNLLRKVFVCGGFEETKKDGTPLTSPLRRTRIPVAEFGAAISIGSKEKVDNDEVECLLVNMIYKNLMKGYISHNHGIVVLSKGGAFPGTGV